MMKNILRLIPILFVFMLFFSGKQHQKKSSMTIVRGLEPSISGYTLLEQNYIKTVAEKLKSNGFPLNLLTRVDLKNNISTEHDYYTYNEITFFINPGVYKKEASNLSSTNIGIGWEDPSVTRTADGGMEFEIGKKINYAELIITFYRVNASYTSHPLLKNNAVILEKINTILLDNEIEDIKYFTAQGLEELLKNHLISITTTNEKENAFEMVIRRMDHELIDSKYFSELFQHYLLKIDLNTLTIEVLDCFDPTFFPSPAPNPLNPLIKKKN